MTRYASNTAVAPRQTGPGTNTHRCTTRHGCPDTAVPTRHGQHDTANTANKTNTADTAPGNQYKRKANNENTTTTSTKRSTSGTQRPRHGLHGPDHGTQRPRHGCPDTAYTANRSRHARLDTQAVANRSVKGIGDTIGLLTLTRFFLHGAMLTFILAFESPQLGAPESSLGTLQLGSSGGCGQERPH